MHKSIVLSILTCFEGKSNRVLSSQFVQGNVLDVSSILNGNLETALQSNSFSTVLLLKLNCFGSCNENGNCHILGNDL